MRIRRIALHLLLVVLVLAGQALFASGAQEAETEEVELSFLTWNHQFYEDTINQWIAEFEEQHPNVTINWIDKKGSELPTYWQTQLAAGTPPDLVDIQGMIWYGYAEDGALLDLTPYYENDPAMQQAFNKDVLDIGGRYKGRLYMLPHYAASTVLFYNRLLFEEAGVDGPPETLEELFTSAVAITSDEVSGFVSLNFDWMYWPLFRARGVEILSEDGSRAAFNTPAAVEVLTQIADLTERGVIDKVTWTGRWAEPNGVFGAGNAGMLHAHINAQRAFRSNSEWAEDPENVGVAPFPGGWSVPNYHSIGVASATEHPELAWEFLKVVMSDKWNIKYGVDIGTMPSNADAAEQLLNDPEFAEENPLLSRMFETVMSVSDNLTGTTGSPKDAQIKDAVYSNIQQAALGQKAPQEALNDAEAEVNRILSR